MVFDKDGAELERFFHEPFGRRVGAGGKPLPGFAPVSGVSLGFTGHRHDDDLGLVDMKGRVYDPVQRRFLTPDPLVSNPFDSQAYNRYAYVRNNPLRYTDPSGFDMAPSTPLPATPRGERPGAKIGDSTLTGQFPGRTPPPGMTGSCAEGTCPKTGASDGRGPAPSTGGTANPAPQSGVTQAIGPDFIDDEDEGSGSTDRQDEDDAENLDPEPSWKDNAFLQGMTGFMGGLAFGVIPFGGIAEGIAQDAGWAPKPSREASIGKGLGEIVGGLIQFYVGVGGTLGGGAVSVTGVGAAVGVPAVVASATLVTGGLANIAAGMAHLQIALSTGGGIGSGTKPASLGSRWKGRDINHPTSESGCEKWARKIQKRIGGQIHTITPKGVPRLGAYRNKNWRWHYHEVVVKDGRVYDAFGGAEGVPIDEFKALWECPECIQFGF